MRVTHAGYTTLHSFMKNTSHLIKLCKIITNHPTLIHPTLIHPTLIHPTLIHPSLIHPTLIHPTLIHPTLIHPTLIHPTLVHPTLIHPTLIHPILIHPTNHHSPLLHASTTLVQTHYNTPYRRSTTLHTDTVQASMQVQRASCASRLQAG